MMVNLPGRKWRTVKKFPDQRASGAMCMALAPTRGQTTREPHGWPPSDPDEGKRRPRETLSRGSAMGIVLGNWC